MKSGCLSGTERIIQASFVEGKEKWVFSKKQFMKGEFSLWKAVEWDLLQWCLFLTADVSHASLG